MYIEYSPVYLTYDEYTTLGGTLDENAFYAVEFEAQTFVNWITYNRLKDEETFSSTVKRCMYDLVSLITAKRNVLLNGTTESEGNSTIKTMQNDGVLVTYNTMSGEELFNALSVDAKRIILRYLNGEKNSKGKLLTYRGLYEDE